jgi:hypothetical protein
MSEKNRIPVGVVLTIETLVLTALTVAFTYLMAVPVPGT